MSVIVYSKPNCTACTMTYRVLDSEGIDYEVIDLTQDEAAFQAVQDLGFRSAPVVVTEDEAWAGFRPDKIQELANRAELSADAMEGER